MYNLLIVLFSSLLMMSSPNEVFNGYKPGDVAADFFLKGTDGKFYSLNSFPNAKGYIVTFTCNHCPYAIMYEDRINEIAKVYGPKGYHVIAINPNDPDVQPADSYDLMKERAAEKGFAFPYLFDDGQKVYPQYGATKTPHVFLLDKNRVVKYIGSIDDNPQDASAVKVKYLENAIAAVEAGKMPEPETTKAIGCSIKFKK